MNQFKYNFNAKSTDYYILACIIKTCNIAIKIIITRHRKLQEIHKSS